MDDGNFDERITKLQNALEEKEKNLMLAAMYGKQLLNEKDDLVKQLENSITDNGRLREEFEQEIYSINLKIETKDGMIKNLQQELEQLEVQHKRNKLEEKTAFEGEKKNLRNQIARLENRNQTIQQSIEQKENQIALLENQLKEAHEFTVNTDNVTIDNDIDEINRLQSQMLCLTHEKESFEKQVEDLTSSLKSSMKSSTEMTLKVESLEQELEQKNCEMTSLFNLFQKSKDEILESQQEIDRLNMCSIDPSKKGNSLFAEVDDHRQKVEKKILSLTIKNKTLSQQLQVHMQQGVRMKIQIASLLSMGNNKVDQDYQQNLEYTVANSKKQLASLNEECQVLKQKLEVLESSKEHRQLKSKVEEKEDASHSNVFQELYKQSQKNLSSCESQLSSVSFEKIALNDEVLQLQRKLRALQREKDYVTAQVIRLKVEVERLNKNKGKEQKLNSTAVTIIKEKLPIDSPDEKQKQQQSNNNNNDNLVEQGAYLTKTQEHYKESLNTELSLLYKDKMPFDKENIATISVSSDKPKKSVNIEKVVTVHDGDKLRCESLNSDINTKSRNPRKPRKVMEAPEVTDLDCKQQ